MTNADERVQRYAEALICADPERVEPFVITQHDAEMASAAMEVADAEQAELRSRWEVLRDGIAKYERDAEVQLTQRLKAEASRDELWKHLSHAEVRVTALQNAGNGWIARTEAAEAKLTRLRELLADQPLIVSGIRRDLDRTPRGRGGELHFIPATPGHGKSGCPGDNLLAWIDDLDCALDGDA